jgi:lysozyme
MKTSESGIRLIAKFEGFRSNPYLDAVGVPTIGYGNTFYPDNSKVTMNDASITEEKGRELLKVIVSGFEKEIAMLVNVCLNQNQWDAIVSFTYNLGATNLKSSTLLKRINSNPCDPDIAYQFSQWNKAKGKTLLGLTRRRKEESDLYFK